MRPINLKKLVIALLIPEAVGGAAAFLSGNIRDTYEGLVRPALSPPGIVFPLVWIILYGLMGIASYLVYDENKVSSADRKNALTFYAVQLALNFLWPIVFFGMKQFTLAAVIIIALDIAVIMTMWKFSKISRPAFLLMIPYLIWLLFATYLNIGVLVLN